MSSEPRRVAWGQRSKSLGRLTRAPAGVEGLPADPGREPEREGVLGRRAGRAAPLPQGRTALVLRPLR